MTRTLTRLTAAKTVANTAVRWIPPFLPTLEAAFGVTTTQLTTVMGVGEMAGLSTLTVGRHLDRRRERFVMIGGLLTIAASGLIALVGSLAAFAVSFAVLIVGVSNFTVAGHAWISDRVDYRWRARSIGLFETAWALGLLLGAPVVAVLIGLVGWRGPFVAIALAAVAAAVLLGTTLPAQGPPPADSDATDATNATNATNAADAADAPADTDATDSADAADAADANGATNAADATNGPAGDGSRMPVRAWLVIAGSSAMAVAGLAVFVISGTWLDDEFGVSTGGLGAIAMAFGAVELVASSSTAAFADRAGKLRSTLVGLAGLVAGLVVMMSAGDRLLVGVAGLLVLLLGFEFGYVTSLSLVSEAGPGSRGWTLAVAKSVGTVTRGAGTIASGWLYGVHGLAGTASLAAAAVVVALAAFLLSRRGAPTGS